MKPRRCEPDEIGAICRAVKGRTVIVVGLGQSGVAAAKLLQLRGASVIATDASPSLSEPARALASLAGVTLVAGPDAVVPWDDADLVVVSPGVPPAAFRAADDLGVPVVGEIEIASHFMPPVPSIAITGTNGKSTTTLLVAALCEASGQRVFAGGNLGTPPAEFLVAAPSPIDVAVLEISSFQAERMPTYRPDRAAFLNASPNHLDRYDGYDGYVAAKGNLFARQVETDVAVAPAGDAVVLAQVRRGRARVLTFGPRAAGTPPPSAWYDADAIVDETTGVRYARRDVRLTGDHNARNVCAALLACSGLVPPDRAREVLATFESLHHRVALVGELAGVRFYDDSKGTNVGATIAAIEALAEERVVLIAGGRDKLGSYDPLRAVLERRGRGAVLIGEAADRIEMALSGALPIARAASMEEAVARALSLSLPGDAVLLSPACSSFDMFRDYKARGDAFVDAVRSLGSGL